jgi:hypothetical protein
MKNNEVRFYVESDLKEQIDNLQKKSFDDLKRTSFYERIFLLGYNELLSQLMNKLPKEVIANLMKIKK